MELNEFHANQFFWFSKETTTHQFGHLNNPYFVWYHLIARWGTEQKKKELPREDVDVMIFHEGCLNWP